MEYPHRKHLKSDPAQIDVNLSKLDNSTFPIRYGVFHAEAYGVILFKFPSRHSKNSKPDSNALTQKHFAIQHR